MAAVGLKLFASLLVMIATSACVPTSGPGSAGAVKSPPAPLALLASDYAATTDSNFAIPALPVDQIPETFRRQTVAFASDEPAGTIIINPGQKLLYLVTGKGQAIRYGVGVGKAGFEWSGEAIINEKKQWPTWTPPAEMIARKPELAKFAKGQPGGLTNPLGARALYLTSNGVDYGYRIHGTPDWRSIGTNASSGCIRMINQDVMDLYSRVEGGSKVIVLTASGAMPKGLTLPPAEPKAKAKANPEATPIPVAAAAVTAVVPKLQTLPQPAFTRAAGTGSAVPQPAATEPAATGIGATPAAAPVVAAPAAGNAAAAPDPAATPGPDAACSVALVNGLCPQP